jgi:hypothetical protein
MSSQAFAHIRLKARPARAGGLTARLGSAFGILTVLGFLVAFPLGGDEPAADASAAKAVAYWSSHSDRQMLASAILAVSAATLVGFGAMLRDALREADSGREPLARVAFAGMVIAATGLLTNVAFAFTAADTAGDVSPQVTQTLSTLSIDFGTPLAIGFALMMIASGIAVIRTSFVPRALGWLSILVGLAGFTPAGEVEFWGLPVWILVLSGALLLRGQRATATS